MADPFTGEIRAFGFNYAPVDWAFCEGQIASVAQYQQLYAIIGNTYGGTAPTSLGLPNLQGTAPLGTGGGPNLTPRQINQRVGTVTVALNQSQMPSHTHPAVAETVGATTQLQGLPAATSFISRNAGQQIYTDALTAPTTTMHAQSLASAGQDGPHENRQPYLALNFCICLIGEWPAKP